MGWSGIQNGPLLQGGRSGIRCFPTVDQGIECQQNPVGLALAVIVMVAVSNDIDDLRPLMPRVRETLGNAAPGTLVKVKI